MVSWPEQCPRQSHPRVPFLHANQLLEYQRTNEFKNSHDKRQLWGNKKKTSKRIWNISQRQTQEFSSLCATKIRKLHSKIIISDLVGFLVDRVGWWKSEVKIQTGTRSNRRPKMAKQSRVTIRRPLSRHWCQASRIWGSGMVLQLNSTGRNRITTAGCLRTDSGWSWTFWITRVTLHDCQVAPLMSQTPARAIFLLYVWPSSNFDFGLSPSDSTEKI